MNAPLRHKLEIAGTHTLDLFAVFHLNLAFSSIEEEARGEVIARCYWPLLKLAEKHEPVGIEATAFTLEEIESRDPTWIARARELIAERRIELIGSGYAQIIGPLVPASVSEANLRIAGNVYEQLLGVRPSIALVNEQAWSGGLVGLYLDAGYKTVLMDWDNPFAHHPEWQPELRYHPQRAIGADGRTIGLLWTNTVAFQKLQRFVHGDIALDDYVAFMRTHTGDDHVLCAYASDGEIFDFRPGRYKTEEKLDGQSEWSRLGEAFAALEGDAGMRFVLPSDASRLPATGAPLRLETAGCPIPVKKQRKYNLSRWAVTGRDDLGVNAACERIYRGMTDSRAADPAWKELCYLWSSDFRTHITDRRWTAFCKRLEQAEQRWARPADVISVETLAGANADAPRHLLIETKSLSARLDRRRGLALTSVHFAEQKKPAIGGLAHGHFDDIALQADWYTGDCVFEAPGEHKVTDLEWCTPAVSKTEEGDVIVAASIATAKGPIEKTLTFRAQEPRIDFDLIFRWEDWGKGCLRLGHFTLLPNVFDWQTLSFATHNGGRDQESFSLAGIPVNHGAPVSFLVSASHGLGMTEGWLELGDAATRIRIDVDRTVAPLLGLLSYNETGGSLFCQLALSALELDDTRKPHAYRAGPRRIRFSVSAAAPLTPAARGKLS
jgi:hypothetical protein